MLPSFSPITNRRLPSKKVNSSSSPTQGSLSPFPARNTNNLCFRSDTLLLNYMGPQNYPEKLKSEFVAYFPGEPSSSYLCQFSTNVIWVDDLHLSLYIFLGRNICKFDVPKAHLQSPDSEPTTLPMAPSLSLYVSWLSLPYSQFYKEISPCFFVVLLGHLRG